MKNTDKKKLTCLSFIILSGQSIAQALPYKDSYLLRFYHESQVNQVRFKPLNPNGGDVNNTLVQFQLSFKYLLISNHPHEGLFLAYTQKSNWNAYDIEEW